MSERSYTSMDKTDWGGGPWNDEPDKLQWIDDATGLDCLIVRNRLGALCGYVGVPSEHPWHGVGYSDSPSGKGGFYADDCPETVVNVHGGLTFSDKCDQDAPEDSGICHVPGPGRPADVWWFGFDCAHSGDIVPGMIACERKMGFSPPPDGGVYKTVDYVRAEVANLARQLVTTGSSEDVGQQSEPDVPSGQSLGGIAP
jgi:hypothetical protein